MKTADLINSLAEELELDYDEILGRLSDLFDPFEYAEIISEIKEINE